MSAISIAFIVLSLAFALLAPRNPDYNFPVSMELFVIGFLHLALAFKPKPSGNSRLLFTSVEKRLFLAALFLLFCVVTPRALYSVGIYGPVPNFCKAAGMNFQIIECMMQTAINGPYGLRTLFQNYIALYIVVLTVCLLRKPTSKDKGSEFEDSKKAPLGLVIICWWMVFFVFASLWLQYIGENKVLPDWLTYTPLKNRLSSIIANPGWVWPYISIGFAAAVSLASAKVRWYRLYWVAASVCALGMLATQQRGVLLDFLLIAFAVFIAPLVSRLFDKGQIPRKVVVKTALGLGAVALVATLLLAFPTLLNDVAVELGYSFKQTNLESGRFGMWFAAIDLIGSAPLWGHGYGSWLAAIANYNRTNNSVMVFDTAHNFYIQLAVELGVLFLIAHVFLVYRLLKNTISMQSDVGRSFWLLFFATVAAVASVQEIDYVRPVYYIFAFSLGALIAAKRVASFEVLSQKPAKAGQLKTPTPKGVFSRSTSHSLVGLSLIGVALYSISVFNIGVYPYEFDHRTDLNAKMSRWLGVKSKISAGQGVVPSHIYAYFPPVDQHAGIPFNIKPINYELEPGLSMKNIEPEVPLIVGAGSAVVPHQTLVESEFGVKDGTRLITKKIGYPVSYSNSFLLPLSENAKYDFTRAELTITCTDSCSLLASSCGLKNYAKIEILSEESESTVRENIRVIVGEIGTANSYRDIVESVRFNEASDSSSRPHLKGDSYVVALKSPQDSHGLIPVKISVDRLSSLKNIIVKGGRCD